MRELLAPPAQAIINGMPTQPHVNLSIGGSTNRMICPHVHSRPGFGLLCNQHGLLGTAVEIGVHQGVFAAEFLGLWLGRRYVGVDPWRVIEGYSEDLEASNALDQAARDKDYELAERAIARYRDRAELLKATSEEAARALPDGLDFIYIDGAHDLASVRRDIALWWPKVRPGGILAGHDYANPFARDVTAAVDEHAAAVGQVVWIAAYNPVPASWYVWKR